MAQLNSLLVTGASRLLGKVYCSDLSIGNELTAKTLSTTGNFTVGGNISSIGQLSVGNSQANGKININGKTSVYDYANNGWLAINAGSQWSGGVYFGTSIIRTDKEFQINNAGEKIKLNTSSAVFNVPVNISKQVTVNNTLVANNAIVTNATVNGLVKAYKYELSTIQDLGGEFCVAPTIYIQTDATVDASKASSTTITVTIKDTKAITSSTIQQVVWSANSKIKFKGKIDGVAIKCDGIMKSTLNSEQNTMALTLTVDSSIADHFATTVNGATYSDISVMLYQRYGKQIGATSNIYSPVGIRMSATGSYDAAPYVDIWGSKSGTDPDTVYTIPSVRLGYLGDLSVTLNGSSTKCVGYGLYADNAYLNGTVISASGTIGGFNIRTNALTNGTWGTDGSVMMCTGSDGSKSIGGSSAQSGWCFTAGSKFGVDKNGCMYATGGKIGGFTLSDYNLIGTNVGLSCSTGHDYAFWAGASTGTNAPFRVGHDGSLRSTSGTIGGWTISSDCIYVNNKTGMSSNTGKWAFWAGETNSKNGASDTNAKFKVGHDGSLYASNATITGTIITENLTATGGKIGKYAITDQYLITGSGITCTGIGGDQAFWAGAESSNSAPFRVGYDGKFTASNAIIDGEINAASGSVGGFKISVDSLYKSSSNNITEDNAFGTNGCYYFGNKGLSLSNNFKVDSSGRIIAQSGLIGNWNIYDVSNTTFRSGSLYSTYSKKNDDNTIEWTASVYICPPDESKLEDSSSTAPFIITRYKAQENANPITTFRLDQYGNIMSRGWNGIDNPSGNNILRINNAKIQITTAKNVTLFEQNIKSNNKFETYSNYLRTNYMCITDTNAFNYLDSYKGLYCGLNAYFNGDIYHNNNKIGETFYSNSITKKAISSSAWTNTASSITLLPGIYVMVGTVIFAASSGGRLAARFATTEQGFDQTTQLVPGTTTAATAYVQCQWVISVTESTKYYLQAWQSTGKTLDVTSTYMKAVRIV